MSVDLFNEILSNPPTGKVVAIETSSDDEQLWREFKGGCQASFALIYKDHFFNLYRYGIGRGYSQDIVKDCIQDLFVELWKYRENLKDTDSIVCYLLKSLRYKLSHHTRTESRPMPDPQALNVLSVEEKLIEEQTLFQHKRKVLKALNQLTQRQQEAVQLKFYHNLKNEEIAERMSISVPAVYNLMSKALGILKKSLGKTSLLILLYFFS